MSEHAPDISVEQPASFAFTPEIRAMAMAQSAK